MPRLYDTPARALQEFSEKMILKIVLLMWFVALALSLVAKAEGRTWMIRLLIGGFCLLLLGFFLKILSRMI